MILLIRSEWIILTNSVSDRPVAVGAQYYIVG